VFVAVHAAEAASYRSDNFAVEAPSAQVARQVATRAEKCRKEIVKQWLGKRGLEWNDVCTVDVELADHGRWGASRFTFYDNGTVGQARISVRGSIDEVLNRVLPHEVTHTVLISYFGRPIPRWADEGAAILSEEQSRRDEHDRRMLRIIDKQHQTYSLRYLFTSRDYPGNLEVFYTQSYSVTRFLVELHGRKTFLAFLDDGMEYGWQRALQTYYKYDDFNDLERAWRAHLEKEQARILVQDLATALADRGPMRSTLMLTGMRRLAEVLMPALVASSQGNLVVTPR
jgi:hypothetical protein